MAASAWLDRIAKTDPGMKSFRTGTERLVTPEATLDRVRPHMQRMGITRLADLTGMDHLGIPVVMACRPNARSVAVSLGKGLTRAAAMASALMESIETWHAERIDRPLLMTSLAELRGERSVIDTSGLALRGGMDFPEHLRILWIEGIEILSDQPVWLPYEIVHTDFRLPMPPRTGCLTMTTNGLASGNHLLEACLHALFEIVERDGTRRLKELAPAERDARRVDLDAIDNQTVTGLIEHFRSAGLEVALWDTALRFDLPSYYCLAAAASGDAHVGVGAGCHVEPSIALCRALTEAAQVRTTYIAGARDDLPRHQFGREAMARDHRDILARIAGTGAGAQRRVPGRPVPQPTFADELRDVLGRLVRGGVAQIAAVDLSGAVPGASVVRLVVPGLLLEEAHA